MNIRILEPEWLDTLPEDDARAQRSRRDLVRVNALMGNVGVVAGLLRDALPAGRAWRIAEVGAGDGTFAARVLARLRGQGELILVDRGCAPTVAVEGWRVRAERADVFDWLERAPPLDAVFANLFLHHFDDAALRRMLAGIAARAPVFAACEPRRSRLAVAGASLLGLIGCNDVTRHDAVVSVRAGFNGRELASLWPAASGVRLEERRRGLFSHAFSACRT